jgi:hypothetical protein
VLRAREDPALFFVEAGRVFEGYFFSTAFVGGSRSQRSESPISDETRFGRPPSSRMT